MTNFPRVFLRALLTAVLSITVLFAGTSAAFAFDGGAGTGGQPGPVNPGTPPVVYTPQPSPCDLICGPIAGGGCGAVGIDINGLPVQCPEPKPTYTLITRICGWDVTGKMASSTGPTASAVAVSRAPLTTVGTSDGSFKNGTHTLTACAASWYVNFHVDDTKYGLYRLVASGQQKSCSWKKWSDGRPLEFSSCGKAVSLPANEFRFTRACSFVDQHAWVTTYNGKPLHFDATDCGDNSPNPQWSCNVGPVQWSLPSTPTNTRAATANPFVTVTGNHIKDLTLGTDQAGALGDAGWDRYRWDAPKITGLDNAKITASRLAYLDGPQNGAVVGTKPGLNTWQPGTVTTWGVAYIGTTPTGSDHHFQAQWQGTGTLTTTTSDVTGYDMKSQTLTFTPKQITTATTFTCTTDLFVTVDRGRNTN